MPTGLLVIAGERKNNGLAQSGHTAVHAQERLKGGFRRVISLPDDADASRISVTCRDGMPRVTAPRRAAKPRHISVN